MANSKCFHALNRQLISGKAVARDFKVSSFNDNGEQVLQFLYQGTTKLSPLAEDNYYFELIGEIQPALKKEKACSNSKFDTLFVAFNHIVYGIKWNEAAKLPSPQGKISKKQWQASIGYLTQRGSRRKVSSPSAGREN